MELAGANIKMIPGLKLIPDAVSHHQEQELLSHIEQALAVVKSETNRHVPGWFGRNRVRRYGWDYDRDKWMGDIPEWVPIDLTWGNWSTQCDSVTINHYLPGNGLLPHIDSLRFGSPILILGLGGDGELVFNSIEWHKDIHVPIPRLGLLIMDGEARYDATHKVLPSVNERFSIVFRKRISQ